MQHVEARQNIRCNLVISSLYFHWTLCSRNGTVVHASQSTINRAIAQLHAIEENAQVGEINVGRDYDKIREGAGRNSKEGDA